MSVADTVVIGLIEVSFGVLQTRPGDDHLFDGRCGGSPGAGASWAWSAETPAAAVTVSQREAHRLLQAATVRHVFVPLK